jgi:hypothetical protein
VTDRSFRREKEVSLDGSHLRPIVRYGKGKAQRKEKAMIARFDHRPMLTAVLALTTTVLVVVITLATLLITAAPPAATSSSEGGANPGAAAAVPDNGEHFSIEGWNNYGHDAAPPQPAKTGNGADSAIDRHAQVVAAYHGLP